MGKIHEQAIHTKILIYILKCHQKIKKYQNYEKLLKLTITEIQIKTLI